MRNLFWARLTIMIFFQHGKRQQNVSTTTPVPFQGRVCSRVTPTSMSITLLSGVKSRTVTAILALASSALPPRYFIRSNLDYKLVTYTYLEYFTFVMQEMKCGMRHIGLYHKFVMDKAFTRRKKEVQNLHHFKVNSQLTFELYFLSWTLPV